MIKIILLTMLLHPTDLRVIAQWEETESVWETVQDCEAAYKAKVAQSIEDTGMTPQGFIAVHNCRKLIR